MTLRRKLAAAAGVAAVSAALAVPAMSFNAHPAGHPAAMSFNMSFNGQRG